MDELDLIEMNEVNKRWAENGNPMLSGLNGASPGAIEGPYGVNIVTVPDKNIPDSHRLEETQKGCRKQWGVQPDTFARCVASTYAIETALWNGDMTIEQARQAVAAERRRPGGGKFFEIMKGPVGAIAAVVGITILILATRPRRS